MKWLQKITLLLFLAVLAMFVVFSVIDKLTTDHSVPVITLETEELEISVKDKKDVLLRGVTAYDKKDGDISDKVLVESVSKFITPGVCMLHMRLPTPTTTFQRFHALLSIPTIPSPNFI